MGVHRSGGGGFFPDHAHDVNAKGRHTPPGNAGNHGNAGNDGSGGSRSGAASAGSGSGSGSGGGGDGSGGYASSGGLGGRGHSSGCQPTMSTYGTLSALFSMNLTHHVEHHDFPGVRPARCKIKGRWAVKSILLGSLHALPMGRTCGEPNETKRITQPKSINRYLSGAVEPPAAHHGDGPGVLPGPRAVARVLHHDAPLVRALGRLVVWLPVACKSVPCKVARAAGRLAASSAARAASCRVHHTHIKLFTRTSLVQAQCDVLRPPLQMLY